MGPMKSLRTCSSRTLISLEDFWGHFKSLNTEVFRRPFLTIVAISWQYIVKKKKKKKKLATIFDKLAEKLGISQTMKGQPSLS